jgi:hypothetical protein
VQKPTEAHQSRGTDEDVVVTAFDGPSKSLQVLSKFALPEEFVRGEGLQQHTRALGKVEDIDDGNDSTAAWQ